MRKTALVLLLAVLIGTACAWTSFKPQPEQGPVLLELDREAGEVGLAVLIREDGSWLEPEGELPEKTTGERRETVRVYNPDTDKTEVMSMQYYLTSVVSGEMPASYKLEALKAQAVAARTYLERKIALGGCSQKEGADICMSSQHCQAFCSEAKQKKNWGDDYEEYSAKIEKAVQDTAGQVLTYDGRVIEALYHSSSGGSTEDVSAVYGGSLSYLTSVDTPEKEEDITVQTSYKRDEFVSIIKKSYPTCGISASELNKQIYIEEYSESGRAARVRLGKISVTGREFRGLLGLRSTDIRLAFDKNNIYITAVGYGHGVGMSQVGANIMAGNGADYREILLHYYKGADIE